MLGIYNLQGDEHLQVVYAKAGKERPADIYALKTSMLEMKKEK